MAEKILQTRICLKHDSWENWNSEAGKKVVLKKGEIGIVTIPQGATVDGKIIPPAIMFKVGDNTTEFQNLNWTSALAADVHAWAKKSENEFVSSFLALADASGATMSDKLNTVFATDAELAAALETIRGEMSDLDVGALAGRVGTLEEGLEAVNERIDNLPVDTLTTGTANGTVAFNGTDVSVKGLGTAAYTNSDAYDAAGSAAAVLGTAADEATANTVYGAKAAAAKAQSDIDAFLANADAGDAALDTLKEIQEFLSGDDGAVQTLLNDVSGLKDGSVPAGKAEALTSGAVGSEKLPVYFNAEGKPAEITSVELSYADDTHPSDIYTATTKLTAKGLALECSNNKYEITVPHASHKLEVVVENSTVASIDAEGKITAAEFDGLASKATADDVGNIITATYATKQELTNTYATKQELTNLTPYELNYTSTDSDYIVLDCGSATKLA